MAWIPEISGYLNFNKANRIVYSMHPRPAKFFWKGSIHEVVSNPENAQIAEHLIGWVDDEDL